MELKRLFNNTWKGINLDLSKEKLPPYLASDMENLRIGREENPMRVLGFTKKLALTDLDIENAEIFKTRGQDYLFINGSDGKIYIYYLSTLGLKSGENTIVDSAGDDLVFTEPVWFANYLNHMWFGNMVEGMYRWREGLNPHTVRGHAPIDVIAEIYDIPTEDVYGVPVSYEDIYRKEHLKFQFAYDYEYRGGRSSLSRPARVNLSNPYQQVKVIMDRPPLISKNRNIYARYALKEIPTEANADWSDWYLMTTVEMNSELSVILNKELVAQFKAEHAYEIPPKAALSPLAKYAEVFDGRLFLGNLVESPTMVAYTDIAVPYFQGTNYFELMEPITNIVGLGQYLIASTPIAIWALRVMTTQRILLTGAMGAYPGSMSRVANMVVWANSYGRWEYDQKGIRRIGSEEYLTADIATSTPGVDALDLTGLEKPKRYFLLTSKSDFDSGKLRSGISTDAVPGAITLQPTYTVDVPEIATEGIIAILTDTAFDFWGYRPVEDWYFDTDEKWRAIPVKIDGDVANETTIDALTVYIQGLSIRQSHYIVELRKNRTGDSYTEPDMTDDGLLSQIKIFNHQIWAERIGQCIDNVSIQQETLFWIVFPETNFGGRGYNLACNLVEANTERFYEHGYIYSSSTGLADSWSEEEVSGKKRYGCFTLHGVSDSHLLLLKSDYVGTTDESFTTTPNKRKYARKFTATSRMVPDYALIAYRGTHGSPTAAKVTVKVLASTYDDTLGQDIPNWTEVIAQAVGASAEITAITDTSLLECVLTLQGDYTYLTPGTDYWFSIEPVDDADNYYEFRKTFATVPKNVGDPEDFPEWRNVIYRADAAPVDTINSPESIWVHLYGSVLSGGEGSVRGFMEQGIYISPTFYIGIDGVFDNGYFTTAKPKNSTILVEKSISTDGESWSAYAAFTSGSTIGGATYKYVKFRITLTLGASDHTPALDSLLVMWHKTGDTGDILYAGVVKGEYWLSRCDKDEDASTKFTYIRNKYGLWYPISEAFWKYIPISEDVVYAIGRKDKDAYKMLYQLDLGNKFYVDDTPVDIEAYWTSGWLLHSDTVKHFRRLRFSIFSEGYIKIEVAIYVDGVGICYTKEIDLSVGHQSYDISIPDYYTDGEEPDYFYARGRRIMIKFWVHEIATYQSQIHQWNLENYEIEYWELPHRNT